ncbi:MAG TPA: sugar phosphate isomerase/epimerase [Planctomycetota bacterium]|nr:sugar phosphate isomerase/epimerase [Planctomycetota bacterium]HRR78614.1 sugar phosphate isomerase/epimerase [Planctomycetota bacterium]HRT94848.1 sugar phosphate isomerase/epimerase [Planctomycetota bacterium]
MIALSTAWYPRSDPRPEAALEAIARMGFQAVEIGIADAMPFSLKRIQAAVAKTGLRVVSVHNVCAERSLDGSNRRGDWLASTDAERRREGVEATLESIANARALGASAVVLHLGSLPIEAKWEKQALLDKLSRGGAAEAERLGVSRSEIVAEREFLVAPRFEAVCRSVEELLARSSDIRLGLECRLGWHELPNVKEVGELLHRFPDPRVGYWHDVGHAVIQDFLGLADQYEWLRRYGARTIGVHLHDVREGSRDHYPPGLGEVDFRRVLKLVPREALRVMEISAGFIEEEVALGRRRLEELGSCS